MASSIKGQSDSVLRKRTKRNNILKSNIPFIIMCSPVIIYLLLFHYLPIFGVVIAFKDFNYVDGIFGSSWVGFDHFKYFFESNDATRVIFNTLGYGIVFHIVGTICSVFIAILLYEITNKAALKFYQTVMALPSFISWVLVAYVAFVLFSNDFGLINQFYKFFGLSPVNWYTKPGYWPWILTIFNVWKGIGISCIIYYAALMGIDAELFEAAKLDGANRFKQILHISLPSILPIICMLSILAVGSVMFGNFGLFYQVPMNSGALYPTTDIIETYLYRGLRAGDLSQSAAVGLFQSAVGLVLVIIANTATKKINPDNAMF